MKLDCLILFVLFVAMPGRLAALDTGTPPLAGDVPIESIPESADLRTAAYKNFLAAPRDIALAARPLVLKNAYGTFKRSSIKGKDAFYLIFAAAKEKDFPLYSQGTWIVKRSLSDGRYLQAKIFLRSDAGSFIRVYPEGERSYMDIVLFGAVLRRELPLPLSFDQVLHASFADLRAFSAHSMDWKLFSPRPGRYSELRGLIAKIRSRLPELRYAEDGALDANGTPVYIANGKPQARPAGLNCSGFAKWLVDGLRKPFTGTWLDPRAMALRHTELRGSSFTLSKEETDDPFFGLDWVRNLGKAMADAGSPSREHGLLENDVTLEPFALFAGKTAADPINGTSAYESYPTRQNSTGYEVRGLKALLYMLAIEEPGNFYLASLNKSDKGGLRRHYHVAALFPYFEPSGEFRVAVFESAAETSLDALIARASSEYAVLVRIRPSGAFDPPILR